MAEPARSPALPAALDGHAWPAQGNWTYEDYLRLPEDGNRYEIIRGNLYVTAAPYPLHQYVCSRLSLLVGGFIDERKLGILLSAPLDVRLPQRIGDLLQVPAKRAEFAKKSGPAGRRPQGSKLVSALTALEEPSRGFDPRPDDGVGVRGGPGDLQRRQLFGQDLAVDAARRGAEEPTAGEEDQGEARLRQPTVWSIGVPPEDRAAA